MEATAHASLRDAKACSDALRRAANAIERAGPSQNPLGTDFFDLPRLLAFQGTCFLRLEQPKAARAVLTEGLALRNASDVKGRAIAGLDLAAVHSLEREPEQAYALAIEALSIPAQYRVHGVLQRARLVQSKLAPWSNEPSIRDLAGQLRAILAA